MKLLIVFTNLISRRIAAAVAFVFLATTVFAEAESDPDGRLYDASNAPLVSVLQALNNAGPAGKNVLVVFGANWCHDSRALAARLNKSPLSEVIEENYEQVFVDVGFYEDRTEVLRAFGVQQYYATPTVLIIDTHSGALVNDEDRHIWGNAYDISMEDSVDYFERWASARSPNEKPGAELQRLYAEIDQFEAEQARRVAGGYAVVGPMLESVIGGNRPSDFDDRWDELRDFRIAIPKDVRELREEAERRIAAGESDVQLTYPEYPLQSWEAE